MSEWERVVGGGWWGIVCGSGGVAGLPAAKVRMKCGGGLDE